MKGAHPGAMYGIRRTGYAEVRISMQIRLAQVLQPGDWLCETAGSRARTRCRARHRIRLGARHATAAARRRCSLCSEQVQKHLSTVRWHASVQGPAACLYGPGASLVAVQDGLITDFLAAEYDSKKLLKAFKKEFACNGTLVDDEEMGQVIQLQGDQRQKVAGFL